MPPWESDQQRKWGHTKSGEEALGGKAAVHEWDEATKGKDLPHKVAKAELDKSMGQVSKISNKRPDAAKMQSVAVKTPKPKMMPGAFDKPSKFFKSENAVPKHPSVRKLYDFLNMSKSKFKAKPQS